MESDHVSVPSSFGPDDCHKLMYCHKSGLLKLDEFSEGFNNFQESKVKVSQKLFMEIMLYLTTSTILKKLKLGVT